MTAYVHSSVLLRLVLGEPPLLREWRPISTAVASAIVEVECLRTLDRLRLRVAVPDRELAARRETVFELLQTFEIVESRPAGARACRVAVADGARHARRHPSGQRVAVAREPGPGSGHGDPRRRAGATAARASGFTVVGSP